ncbi:alpha/beta hydrolase [Loktanella sp. DJP18]|uniref:alpha/beta hydrolase n=1 Tax=Loktanella sp. DJP18 TaxID=3409788 RepID=UPI003BB4EB42
MAAALENRGHEAVFLDYPSTEADIVQLTDAIMPVGVKACAGKPTSVVAHSMGGLILRTWLRDHEIPNIHRVVMLGTPNQGSDLADALGDIDLYHWINGPAGADLMTGPDGIASGLPPANFELGVIAGDLSLNPVFSSLVDGPDDGKVSVASTRLNGMKDHIVMHTTHTFMMNNPLVIAETAHFIERGTFNHDMGITDAAESIIKPDLDRAGG